MTRRLSARLMGGALIAALAGLSAPSVLGQAVPGRDDQPQPSRGGNGGILGGLGGFGLSIKLGKKKKKQPPAGVPTPAEPALEMRDADIPDFLPDQVIFVVPGDQASNGVSSDLGRIARAARVTIFESYYLDQSGVTMAVAQISGAQIAAGDNVAAAAARLEKQQGTGWAQPNHQFQLLGKSLPKRFAMHAISEKNLRVSGHITMIDAPADLGHDNLKGASTAQRFYGVTQSPAVHGTAVAALLVGTGAYPGTAQGAQLTSLAAFGPSASGALLSRTSYLAKAMNEASRLRPDVLNLSFGGPRDRLLGLTLDTIRANGICVSAAGGNGGPTGKILFPASHPASLAVTAVDENLRGYAHASQGGRVDIAGVGVGLNAAVPGGRRAVSGTSFAAAVISGALLRMPACGGGRDPAAMKMGVAALAQDLGEKGRDPVFGDGLFRLGKAKRNNARKNTASGVNLYPRPSD